MAIAAVTTAVLSGLVKQFSAGRFESTINNDAPLIGSGVLMKREASGEELIKEVYVGGHSATAFTNDGGLRPKGAALVPIKARQMPTLITSTLTMGRMAALARLDEDRVAELFDSNLTAVAEDCARHLNRAMYGGSNAPQAGTVWSSTAVNGTATVNFLDISMFKPGAAYDWRDSTNSKDWVVRCTGVTGAAVGANSANVAGSVSFINDVPDMTTGAPVALTSVTIAVGDLFRLRGTGSTVTAFGGAQGNGAAMVSIDDIAGSGASTTTIHGIAPGTVPSWIGQTSALAGPYTQEAALSFFMRGHQYSGSQFTDIIMSPQMGAAHAASAGYQGAVFGVGSLGLSAATPRNLGNSMDKFAAMAEGYESGLRLSGKNILIDPNAPATTVIFHNRDKLKLAVWQDMEPEDEDGNSNFVSRTSVLTEAYITGAMNLFVEKRLAIGTLTGITNL